MLYNTDIQLWKNLRQSVLAGASGSAALNISSDGSIHNGMCVLGRFKSRQSAVRTLKAAGYVRKSYGWKAA